jgi:hypothetical protein
MVGQEPIYQGPRIRVETKTFFHFREILIRKIFRFRHSFRENFRVRKFLRKRKCSRKLSFKGKFFCEKLPRIFHILTLFVVRVVDEISLSRNFAKYLFRISRNNFISRNFVSRNMTKFREIFVTKLKFSQGKIHFWIFLHTFSQYHQKDKFYVKSREILENVILFQSISNRVSPYPLCKLLSFYMPSNVFDIHIW